MKALATFIFLFGLVPGYAQQKALPSDGNGILESCGVLVTVADNPTVYSSLNQQQFAEKMSQFNWCAGYLDATHDLYIQNHVNLALVGMLHVTLSGEARESAFEILRGPCIPDQVSVLQLARVLVKWLKDHPERLHETKVVLTMASFKDAFPCKDTPKKDISAPPVKP